MGAQKKLMLFFLVIPMALAAKAGTGKLEGVLNGYVTDAVTKKPLPGVMVSAIIPGSNSLKEVITDADGYFKFSELPITAQVTVQFDKKGYQSLRRPNVALKEKTSVKINIECFPEGITSDSDDSEFPILRLLQAS